MAQQKLHTRNRDTHWEGLHSLPPGCKESVPQKAVSSRMVFYYANIESIG